MSPLKRDHFVASFVAALVVSAVGVGCQRAKPDEPAVQALTVAETNALRAALITYADVAFNVYADAVNGAQALEQSVNTFVSKPSAEGLTSARQAWVAARRSYQQSEVFRFYDGPIDRVELRVNTWPIDEGYVEDSGTSRKLGIIDDAKTYPELTHELLSSLNAKEGETSISLGYHVVEFLLWGADTRADGPGDRPYSDYVGKAGETANRRGLYLRAALELLVRDLSQVRDEWAPNRANYRAKLLAMDPSQAFGLAIKGVGSLSGPELAGERLTVPYETKSQENEHSCFSDNTVADLADDVLGIQNLCLGRYEPVSGRAKVQGLGLCDAIAARSPELAKRLRNEIASSLEKVRAIPSPFDQAMLGTDAAPGRQAIQAAIAALQAQTSSLGAVAATYDIRLSGSKPQP